MTNPYAVPLEDLDAVHVTGAELVEEQQSPCAGPRAGPSSTRSGTG
jgi:hypothetical protein